MTDDAKMNRDEQLRSARLVFYKDDIDHINKLLEEFIKLSKATAVFMIDKDGHLITQVGKATDLNPEVLSALVAGSFAATKEVARMLGETEFTMMFHKGKRDHIQLCLVGDRAIGAILFNESTTAGMVNLYALELVEKLTKRFDVMRKQMALRKDQAGEDDISSEFGDHAKGKLDELFGG